MSFVPLVVILLISLSFLSGIVKLTDFMEISLIAMPAKLLILGPGEDRFRLENEQFPVNLTVPFFSFVTDPFCPVGHKLIRAPLPRRLSRTISILPSLSHQ